MSAIDERELQKLLKNMRNLPEKMQKGIFSLGIKRGAKTLVESAQSNVPSDLPHSDDAPSVLDKERDGHSPNYLKDSIKLKKTSVRQIRRNGDDPQRTPSYTVGIDIANDYPWYAHWIEFGTKWNSGSFYMTKAFQNNGMQAVTATTAYIKKRFDNAVKKGLI